MIPNNLTLRVTDSPFVTPYNDVNQNSILSRKQLDGNFIYLKGETIYSAESTTTGVVLKKLNGQEIVVDFTNFTGGTSSSSGSTSGSTNQDNRFRFINLGYLILGGRGVVVDETNLDQYISSRIQYRLDNTDLTVDEDELIIFKCRVVVYGAFNEYDYKFYFPDDLGKGVYNPLGATITYDMLEIAYKELKTITPDFLLQSPNVNLINLGTIPTPDYLDYINNNGASYDFSNPNKIHYFRFNYNGGDYIYVFDPNQSLDGYSVYGLGLSQFSPGDLVLFYDSTNSLPNPNTNYWTAGSTGFKSLKAINDSTIDSTGDYAIATGFGTLASGDYSHAEGIGTEATAQGAHAEGNSTHANSTASHAEGGSTYATGYASHAEGSASIASGSASHAEGEGTYARGSNSHAEGAYSIASGYTSHAQGLQTQANGDYSHAGGRFAYANGLASFIHGSGSTVNGKHSIVLGRGIVGNADDTTYVDNFNIKTEPSTNNSLDKVLSRDSNGDIKSVELSKLKTVFSGTYATLKVLKDNNELIVGNKYILSDYQTKYIINGSDSSTRQQLHTMIGAAGAYTQFQNVPNTIAANGDVVTCVYAPSGATITSGQTFTIIDYFNVGYIRFSPIVKSLVNLGAIFRFEKQRYPNIPNNIVINDVNGKPVIKPSGVINTDVHDNLPYMSMTGAENVKPITERIVLTAIDSNTFSLDAESLTFLGDKLLYDFTNTNILDDNGYVIGTRNGLITKRINLNQTISTDNDWRVQRYRRYLMDDVNWNGMLLKKNLSTNPVTSGSTIYSMFGINFCTNTNPTLSNNHKYVMSEPYKANFYSDFAKTVPNPFISGTTSAPDLGVGFRFSILEHTSEYSVDVSLPISGFSGTTLAKDFNIIPLVNHVPTSQTTYFKINSMSNVICLNFTQRYGNSGSIYVDSSNGSMRDSTFLTGPTVINNKDIRNVTATEYISITNTGQIFNCIINGYGAIDNKGKLINNNFGGGYVGSGVNEYFNYFVSDDSSIIDSVFGMNRCDILNFNNLIANKCIFINRYSSYSSISGKQYLTQFKSNGFLFGSSVTIDSFSNQIPLKGYYGYVYDYNTDIYDTELNNFNQNRHLVYQNVDSGNTISIVNVVNVQ